MNFTSVKLLAGAALFKVAAALTVASTGGDVPWTWVGMAILADICFGAGRILKGESIPLP